MSTFLWATVLNLVQSDTTRPWWQRETLTSMPCTRSCGAMRRSSMVSHCVGRTAAGELRAEARPNPDFFRPARLRTSGALPKRGASPLGDTRRWASPSRNGPQWHPSLSGTGRWSLRGALSFAVRDEPLRSQALRRAYRPTASARYWRSRPMRGNSVSGDPTAAPAAPLSTAREQGPLQDHADSSGGTRLQTITLEFTPVP